MVFVLQATAPRAPGVCPALPCPVDTRGTSSHTQQRRLACPASSTLAFARPGGPHRLFCA